MCIRNYTSEFRFIVVVIFLALRECRTKFFTWKMINLLVISRCGDDIFLFEVKVSSSVSRTLRLLNVFDKIYTREEMIQFGGNLIIHC